jgi:hypothetical protein
MLEMVRQLSEDAAKVAASSLWSLTDSDLVGALQLAHQLECGAAALKARIVHQAVTRKLPHEMGHRSTAGWLRALLLIDPRPARELAEQADAVGNHAVIEQAVLDGAVDLAQAVAIASTVDAIPATLNELREDERGDRPTTEIVGDAERMLIDFAGQFPAFELRRLGDRILAHVAPEIAERADEEALRRQEARAHAKRSLSLSLPIDGMVRVSGALSVEDAAVVAAALHPLCVPRPNDDRTPGQCRADALVDLCRLALRTGELPDDGGEPPQVTVTVPFDPIAARLGIGVLDNGDRISAQSARRMGCDARVLPVVLGGASQVLDAGRSRRLATGPLRRALVARDRGCAFPDCDRPARWCDAHHLRHWADGGGTNLDNLVLLCRHHHRALHDPKSGWDVRLGLDSLPEFLPPRWIDAEQRPRRNLYHPRT